MSDVKFTQSRAAKFRGVSHTMIAKWVRTGLLPTTLADDGVAKLHDKDDIAKVSCKAPWPSEAVQQKQVDAAVRELAATAKGGPTSYEPEPRAIVPVRRRVHEGQFEEEPRREPLTHAELRREAEEKNRVTAEVWRLTHYTRETAAAVMGMRPKEFDEYAKGGRIEACRAPLGRDFSSSKGREELSAYPVLAGLWYRRDEVERNAAKLEEARRELLRLKGAHPDTPVSPRVTQRFIDIFEALPDDALSALGADEKTRALLRTALTTLDKVSEAISPTSVPGSSGLPPGTIANAPAGPVSDEDIAKHEAETEAMIARMRVIHERAKARNERDKREWKSPFPAEWRDSLRAAPLAETLARLQQSPVSLPPGTTSAAALGAPDVAAANDTPIEEPPSVERPCNACDVAVPAGKMQCEACGRWQFAKTG
jgi:hypothetical protein